MVRPVERRATVGKTRSCPHCRATILESSAVCPACRHHLRFESRRGEEPRGGQPGGAQDVRRVCARDAAAGPGEYHVVVVIRDAGGAELARKVIGVGGLAPGEERKVELSASRSSTRCPGHDAQDRGTAPLRGAHPARTRRRRRGPALLQRRDRPRDAITRPRTGLARISASMPATTPRCTWCPASRRKRSRTGELDVRLAAPRLRGHVDRRGPGRARPARQCRIASYTAGSAPDSRRVFLADPAGNLVELHQLGTCRCTARAREGIGQARVSGTVLFADMRGFHGGRRAPVAVGRGAAPERVFLHVVHQSRTSTAARSFTWRATA